MASVLWHFHVVDNLRQAIHSIHTIDVHHTFTATNKSMLAVDTSNAAHVHLMVTHSSNINQNEKLDADDVLRFAQKKEKKTNRQVEKAHTPKCVTSVDR